MILSDDPHLKSINDHITLKNDFILKTFKGLSEVSIIFLYYFIINFLFGFQICTCLIFIN
jgi:hypothetical protein